MVLFFSATLLISIAGLVALFWIKNWELRSGRMILAGVRPRVGRFAHASVVWFERVLPRLVVTSGTSAATRAQNWLHRASAYALLGLEHGLEHTLKRLRGVTEQPRPSKEASQFLREVAAHKRTLLSRRAPNPKKEIGFEKE